MHGVDYVALSFVRRPEDILDARRYIQQVQAELGQGSDQAPLPLIAKLEKPATPDAPSLKRPYNWRVHDDDQGMQMRWIGLTLVIDRGLLMSRHFPPLLAHELAHVNSFDLLTRSLYAILPPFRWGLFTLLGLPLACGPIVLHLVWMKYWRDRVFAADEYAARLGQRHALKRALDDLRWVLDGGRATKGGRWLRETPYIEERIDRLDRYQPPVPQTVV